jgi:hypothetical protein
MVFTVTLQRPLSTPIGPKLLSGKRPIADVPPEPLNPALIGGAKRMQVEVFEADEILFVAEFDFLPRVGEYVAREAEGYFQHYDVLEVWHRLDGDAGTYRACIRVELDD